MCEDKDFQWKLSDGILKRQIFFLKLTYKLQNKKSYCLYTAVSSPKVFYYVVRQCNRLIVRDNTF